MKSYSEKCRTNLLEKSLEKDDYDTALKEWYFLYEVIDNNENIENKVSRPSCELCEHEDLRWQFVIYNVNNDNKMKVGSSCIKQFDLALLDKDGNKIYGKERNTKVNKLITLERINSSNKMTFKAMNDLSGAKKELEQNKLFIDCWTQLKVNGTLEPKLGLFLINNFIECDIDFSQIELRIDLQKKKYAEQINRMSKNAYVLIRPYLNVKKQELFDKKFSIEKTT